VLGAGGARVRCEADRPNRCARRSPPSLPANRKAAAMIANEAQTRMSDIQHGAVADQASAPAGGCGVRGWGALGSGRAGTHRGRNRRFPAGIEHTANQVANTAIDRLQSGAKPVKVARPACCLGLPPGPRSSIACSLHRLVLGAACELPSSRQPPRSRLLVESRERNGCRLLPGSHDAGHARACCRTLHLNPLALPAHPCKHTGDPATQATPQMPPPRPPARPLCSPC
jgi:hypothetical protein